MSLFYQIKVRPKLERISMSKIWISRDGWVKEGWVKVWGSKPDYYDSYEEWGCAYKEPITALHPAEAKLIFGFTPRKGKLYEYTPKGNYKEVK